MNNLEKVVELLARLALCRTAQEEDHLLFQLETALNEHPLETPLSVEDAVEAILIDVGVPCKLSGHGYIVAAVCEMFRQPNTRCSMSGVVYPAVAKKYGSTAACVERAIRHAVEAGWNRADIDVIHNYFGNTVDWNRGKPTNTEFLWQLYNIIKKKGVAYEVD